MNSSLILNVGVVMKSIYMKPVIEVIEILRDEIIVTSNDPDSCDNFDNAGK